MNKFLLAVLFLAFLVACNPQNSENSNSAPIGELSDSRPAELVKAMEAVKPFFEPMRAPGPNDWLASFNEPGQTFQEYLSSNPTVPTDERDTIYVLPLGNFTAEQEKVIEITRGYLEAFFGLPVKKLPIEKIKRPLDPKDTRISEYFRHEQVRTGYILDDVLRPMLPDNAAALIAFTNEDLYPDETMNYVFGQASMENRVGVWSLYWLNSRGTDFDTFLRRTIKIAAHETGHMFSMHHCTKYNCVMSGANQLDETDYHPLDACPECMAKICWFSRVSPTERYRRLSKFCRQNRMDREAEEFEKKYQAIFF